MASKYLRRQRLSRPANAGHFGVPHASPLVLLLVLCLLPGAGVAAFQLATRHGPPAPQAPQPPPAAPPAVSRPDPLGALGRRERAPNLTRRPAPGVAVKIDRKGFTIRARGAAV